MSSASGSTDPCNGPAADNEHAQQQAAPQPSQRPQQQGPHPGELAAAAADAAQEEPGGAPETAAAGAVDGGSDYAAPDVEGVSAPDIEALVADLARRLELGEPVDPGVLQLLQDAGVIRIRRREATSARRPPVLEPLTLEGVAAHIKAGRAKRIIIMCGAGVSVSAGIPDFRTPGTGLYSQLDRLNLPTPEAVFEMNYFRRNPKPFHILAKELFPGNFAPTPAHVFMKLLLDKGLLLRVYTQNIDSLEHQAGLPCDRVVAAHGNFDTAHCIKCGRQHSVDYVKEAVFADKICHCSSCGGLVKPDIVFFGESLPDRFYDMAEVDFPRADLLIVLGTSLVVHPFASLIGCVGGSVPRLLINRERVGEDEPYQILQGVKSGGGFDFDAGYRDVLHLGDCDDGCRRLAALLGWGDELEAMVQAAGCGAPGGSGGAARVAAGIAKGVERSEAAGEAGSAVAGEGDDRGGVDGQAPPPDATAEIDAAEDDGAKL